MNILDQSAALQKYNSAKIMESIAKLPEQAKNAYLSALALKLPFTWRKFNSIVVCGIGGSNLASELWRALFGREAKIPMVLVRHYHLPNFADKNTLVIISSYSGNTEETVSCLQEAIAKKAKIICLAQGGKVLSLAKKHRLPYFPFDAKDNPSRQPRYSLGSQFGALLGLLTKLKIQKLNRAEILADLEYLEVLNALFDANSPLAKNPAKQLAVACQNKMPFVVAANFLSASAHILANQINESAKNFAVPFTIPELNHHLLESLSYPKAAGSQIKFLFFSSSLYPERIQKRFQVTEKILAKQKIDYLEYHIKGESRLMAALEILLLGSWLSFYLAALNGQNPAAIPWVDLFKSELR